MKRTGTRQAILLAILLVCGPSGASAQTPPPAAKTPSEEAPAEPAPPQPIPLVDVPAERERLEDLRRNVEAELQKSERVTQAEQDLAVQSAAIDDRQARTDATLEGSPTLDELRELEGAWRALDARMDPLAASLTARIEQLDSRRAELERRETRWQLTLDDARKSGAPAAVVQGIRETLDGVAATNAAIDQRRSLLLSVRAQVGTEEGRITSALDRIHNRREALVKDLLSPSAPPLWQAEAWSAPNDDPDSLARSVGTDWQRISEFAVRRAGDIALHGLFFLVLCFGLRSARDRASGRDEDAPSTLRVLDHPISLAFVLAMLPAGAFYPEMPLLLSWFVFAAMIPALILITRDYVATYLRPILYAIGAFILVDLVRDIIAPLATVARLVFIAEMLLVGVFVYWLLRPSRLAALAEAERIRGLRAAGTAARIAAAACLLAAFFDVIGLLRMARLLGEGVLRSGYTALFFYASAQALHGLGAYLLRRRPLRLLNVVIRRRQRIERGLSRALLWLAAVLWVVSSLDAFALWEPFRSAVSGFFGASLEIGEVSIALGDVATFVFLVWLSFAFAGAVRFVLNEEVFSRVRLARGVPYAITTLVGYGLLFLGFLLAVAAAGFDLTRFTILAGAFGVGIGFGLQNVVNNFVSGLILLFERPVQVGDTLQLGDVNGEVRRIGIRSSTVRTWEGADVVVPNGDLISQRVTNWTLADRNRRIDLPVGVAYGSDPHRVIALLEAIGRESPDVLTNPSPQALFLGFGDSSLDFVLRIWTSSAERWAVIRSETALAVHDALREANIEIPFPQRDLHVRSVVGPRPQAEDEPS